VSYRERIKFASCPFSGERQGSKKLMNVGALTHVMRNREAWRSAARLFATDNDLAKSSLPESLFRVGLACTHLPHVWEYVRSEGIPSEVAAVYKFFRGIAFYAEHSLLTGDAGDLGMAGYAERNSLLVGRTEVCPASPELMSKVERELDDILRRKNGAVDGGACITREDVQLATRISGLLTLFCASLASYVAVHHDMPDKPLIAIPYWESGTAARRASRTAEFLLGTGRVASCLALASEATKPTLHFIHRLQDQRLSQQDAWTEMAYIAYVINKELSETLKLVTAPAQAEVDSVLRKVMYSAHA